MKDKNKALDEMSFKQRKKEWENTRKRLEPENEYLEALTRNLELKIRHKKLLEEFRETYSDEIDEIESDPDLRSLVKKEKEGLKEE